MKSKQTLVTVRKLVVLAAMAIAIAGIASAQTNALRIALTPFSAQDGIPWMRQSAIALPDLLTAALSQDGRFQLVEREKINGIWNEMHLTEAGLVSADTVAKLGQLLACDRLVSGSLIQTETGPQMWLKLIDTQSGVVLDLQSFPYSTTNFSANAQAAADFLARAAARGHPREFIALDKFEDRTADDVKLEDWTPRLKALIEEHFLKAGYGVVERQSVAPIFSEYQLQTAGMTADPDKRVKLKPAFWIVGGNWEWVIGPQNQINVAIKINKMGGGSQLLSFVMPPGETLEKMIVDSIQGALKDTGSVTEPQALAAEQKYGDEHIDQLAKGREGAHLPSRFDTNAAYISVTNPRTGEVRQMTMDRGYQAQRQGHAEEGYKALQQAILLNPKDMKAKFYLGMSLFGRESDPVQSRQGEDLLKEVAASGDAVYATRAKNWLDDIHSGKITFEHDQLGFLHIVTHGQPASLPPVDTNAQQRAMAEMTARMEKEQEAQKIATRAETDAKIAHQLQQVAIYKGVTAVKLFQRNVIVACSHKLETYNLDSGARRAILLPQLRKQTVGAIEINAKNLWVGTDSGLIRYSLADGSVREFGPNDGFPAAGITALRLVGERLFVGFRGTFGCFDTGTEKYTGFTAGANPSRDWNVSVQNPPTRDVDVIDASSDKDLWISSQTGFQHLDLAANAWSLGIPMSLIHEIGRLGSGGVAASKNYVVLQDFRHCVAVCPQPGTNWFNVNLEGAPVGPPQSSSAALDSNHPDWLWVGGYGGGITLMDLSTMRILAEGKESDSRAVFSGGTDVSEMASTDWIMPSSDKVVFMVHDQPADQFVLCYLDKSLVPGGPSPVVASAAEPNVEINGSTLADSNQKYLLANFDKLKTVQFQKDSKGVVSLQKIGVKEHTFSAGGAYYCGFKFTTPDWLDGDVVMYSTLAKTEKEKDFSTGQLDVHFVNGQGADQTLEVMQADFVSDCPQFKQQLPYSIRMLIRRMDQGRLEPGKTYGVVFEYVDDNLPDIAFAIGIDSARGQTECGKFPMFDPASAVPAGLPATPPDLCSRVEAAMNAKDEDKLIDLVCWQNVSEDEKVDYVANTLDSWLDSNYAHVELQSPSPDVPNQATGIQPDKIIPATGDLKIYKAKFFYFDMSYGRVANGFLLTPFKSRK